MADTCESVTLLAVKPDPKTPEEQDRLIMEWLGAVAVRIVPDPMRDMVAFHFEPLTGPPADNSVRVWRGTAAYRALLERAIEDAPPDWEVQEVQEDPETAEPASAGWAREWLRGVDTAMGKLHPPEPEAPSFSPSAIMAVISPPLDHPLRYDLRQAGPSIRTDVGLDGTVTRTRHDHNGTVVERIVHGRDGAVIERPTLVAKVGAGPEPEVVGEEEEGSFSIDGFLQCEIGGVCYRCSPPLLTIAGERIRRADITRGGRTVGLMVNGKRHDLVPETKAETPDEPDQPACLDDHPLYGRKK
jgi:hypothetical protein